MMSYFFRDRGDPTTPNLIGCGLRVIHSALARSDNRVRQRADLFH